MKAGWVPFLEALWAWPVALGERHTLGLLMITDMLRAGGIDIHILGEGAPAESIRDLAVELGADLFASRWLGNSPSRCRRPDCPVPFRRPGIVVAVGGRAFGGQESLALSIGADHFAADARGVRNLAPRLLASIGRNG